MKNIFFVDDNDNLFPEWQESTVGDLVKITTGKKDANAMTENGDYAFFTCSREVYAIDDYSFEGEAILLAGNGNIGEPKYYNGKFDAYQRTYVLQDFSKVHPKYLLESIERFFPEVIARETQTGSMPYIRLSTLASLKTPLPSLPEQQKIAEFFSALDERIDLQAKKVSLLKEQKKGYQQRVFNRELVFTDDNGNAYPEWEEKKLGDVALVKMGQSPDGKSYSEDSSQTVLIQGNADMKKGKIIPRIYTSEGTKFCNPGDIIMSVRAPVGALAKSEIYACLGRGVCSIEANDYMYQYLNYFNTSSGWDKISQGSTFESVNSTDIKGLILPTPSLHEQEKIAEFFSALDENIELNERKLELLKNQKKGYLQGIFG